MISKILILGAQGQLGKAFAKYFDSKNLDYLAPDEKDCDITNRQVLKDVFEQYKPSFLINCAAFNAVDEAEENQDIAFKINKEAVEIIADICKSNDCQLVHYGSDYVFDGNKLDYYFEEDPTSPLNIYGESKLAGERATLAASDSFLVFRLSWVIGEGQQNFLFKLNSWAQNNRILKISADEVSIPTFTDDIVNLTIMSLEKGLTGLYHMTSSQYASRYELARFYIEHSNLNNIVVPVPMSSFDTKAARPQFSPMSNQRLANDLNVSIPSWEESLCEFLNKGK